MSLAEYIFEYPDYTILFNEASVILHDKVIAQHYRETVEIYKYQHLGLSLNRDSGDLRINESFFGFLKREVDTLIVPDISLEPPSQSHMLTRQQPLRCQRVFARNAVVNIRNPVT
jgi:hypothetical protein